MAFNGQPARWNRRRAAWTSTQNLANGSTDGYRRQTARGFLLPKGARVVPVTSPEHGALRRTGRQYDLTIVGNGAFHIRAPGGRAAYTRNGAFVRDRDGHLGDDVGRLPIGTNGRPLVVSAAGNVTAKAIGLSAGSSLQTGALESSAVDAISEMIDVLSAQRAYEGAQKIIAAIDETRRQAADSARVKG